MSTVYTKPQWSFYPIWILATLLVIPVAFFLDLMTLRLITRIVGDFIYVDGVRHITEDYLSVYPFVLFAGLLMGLFQYGLLRRYLPNVGGWILTTLSGWLLGLALNLVVVQFTPLDTALPLDAAFLFMGLSIGVAQWLLLQRRFPKAAWWIAANVLGWGLQALMTDGNSLDQFGLLTLGFLPACVTAVTFWGLIRQLPVANN